MTARRNLLSNVRGIEVALRLHTLITSLMLALGLAVTPGCASLINRTSAVGANESCTFLLPGIETTSAIHAGTILGLRRGGVPGAIEVVEWTTGVPPLMLYHLRGEPRNREQASKLARRIVAYQDANPGRPVHLIGHSGGAGIVVWALEALPCDRQVQSVILLAPAISPDYDMGTALRRTTNGIWNFSSRGDIALDCVGTSVAGTIDGTWQPAAGWSGFRRDLPLDSETQWLYQNRLYERPFRLDDLWLGHLGGHWGSLMPRFAREKLAPILLMEPTTDGSYLSAPQSTPAEQHYLPPPVPSGQTPPIPPSSESTVPATAPPQSAPAATTTDYNTLRAPATLTPAMTDQHRSLSRLSPAPTAQPGAAAPIRRATGPTRSVAHAANELWGEIELPPPPSPESSNEVVPVATHRAPAAVPTIQSLPPAADNSAPIAPRTFGSPAIAPPPPEVP